MCRVAERSAHRVQHALVSDIQRPARNEDHGQTDRRGLVRDWFALLPPDLSERAYRDHGERAWVATDVIAVVTILRENGCDLLGMEIWLPTHPGPTIPMPYFHHWEPGHGLSATAAVETFAWDRADRAHHGMVPYINVAA